MSSDINYDKLRQLIDIILKIDRSSLNQLRILLDDIDNQKRINHFPILRKSDIQIESSKDKEKQQLIGMLPYVLLDRIYFPSNDLLAIFAKNNLEIEVRHHEKRSRNEILGTIIAEVANKNPQEIAKFIQALNKIIGKEKKGKISNFFLEWDKVIREE